MARRPWLRTPVTAALCLLAGCALSSAPSTAPATDDLGRLERALAADSTDLDSALLLAAAHLFEHRADEAERVVELARRRFPDAAAVTLLRGLVAEERGDSLIARALYREIVARPDRATAFDAEVQGRIDRVEAVALRAEIRAAIERGTALVADAVPLSVAIVPPAVDEDDPYLAALAASFAALLAEDLGAIGQVTVVDPRWVDAARAVLGDGAAGATGQAAERIGFLLGARRVLSGRLARVDGRITLSAVLASTAAGGPEHAIAESAAAESFYQMEKRVALAIYAELGISLTAAQQSFVTNAMPTPGGLRGAELMAAQQMRVGRGQSAATDALVYFGRGLIAESAGDYRAAALHFEDAGRGDLGFNMAYAHERRAAALAASMTPPGQLAWRVAQVERQARAVDALRLGPAYARTMPSLDQPGRALLAELLGQGLGKGAVLEIGIEVGGVAP